MLDKGFEVRNLNLRSVSDTNMHPWASCLSQALISQSVLLLVWIIMRIIQDNECERTGLGKWHRNISYYLFVSLARPTGFESTSEDPKRPASISRRSTVPNCFHNHCKGTQKLDFKEEKRERFESQGFISLSPTLQKSEQYQTRKSRAHKQIYYYFVWVSYSC